MSGHSAVASRRLAAARSPLPRRTLVSHIHRRQRLGRQNHSDLDGAQAGQRRPGLQQQHSVVHKGLQGRNHRLLSLHHHAVAAWSGRR